LEKFLYKLEKFDVIIMLEVIEHIKNDVKLIENISKLLKNNGVILLTTPYKNYKHMLGDFISEKEDGSHVRWGYTHKEIERIFNKNGFIVLSKEYVSGFISQQISNFMRLLSVLVGVKGSWFITFPLRTLQIFDDLFTKIIGYPYACIGIVGAKKASN